MNTKRHAQSFRVLLVVAVSLAFVLTILAPTYAQSADAPALKADTPRVDPSADAGRKELKPLQAGIEHNEHLNPARTKALRSGASDGSSRGFRGKLRGGAQNATADTLKGNAGNNALSTSATSGFGVIGVKFVLAGGAPPVINRVFAGTPAEQVGLSVNDKIVAVDGVPTYGLTKEEVYDLIIGSPGTTVNLSIQHFGDFRVVTCTRMDINDITDPLVRRDYLRNM